VNPESVFDSGIGIDCWAFGPFGSFVGSSYYYHIFHRFSPSEQVALLVRRFGAGKGSPKIPKSHEWVG